jgi:formate hydrogenlyase subunit 6/NADH:ubiquinone oxidoreductase subunit I
MLDRIVTHQSLLELVDELGRDWQIVGPVARSVPRATPPVRYFYQTVESAADLALDFTYAVYGPKGVLFPPHEALFRFDVQKHGFEAVPSVDATPIALIGVHPCDLHAIQTLDFVFSHDVLDEHYQRRRENLFIAGIDCASECTDGVFCADMHTNHADSGFDLMLYPLSRQPDQAEPQSGDRYGVVFGSEAGRAWLTSSKAGRAAVVPTPRDQRDFENYQARKQRAFAHRLKTGAEGLPAMLEHSYDSLLWEATARRCYSCGSCNLVCPTCYCFDIHDENDLTLTSGRRVREWDGCQLRDFAVVAGGHNFRESAAARLRHRIFRKGAWISERTGLRGCVGCARCSRACTAKIGIVEIFNQLAEEG